MTEIPAGYKTAYRLIAIVRMKIKGNYGKKTKKIPFLTVRGSGKTEKIGGDKKTRSLFYGEGTGFFLQITPNTPAATMCQWD